MATAEQLVALVGKPVKRAAFRGIVAKDQLKASVEEDLEEGQPVETYYIGKKAGYEILTHSGRVVAIFIHAEKSDGYSAFPGPLPRDIPRGATRTQVRRLLGKPEQSGRAYTDSILGPQGAWDRFVIESIYLHVEYSNPGLEVRLITLMNEVDAP